VDGGAAKETQAGIGRGRSRRRSVERSVVPTNIREEVKTLTTSEQKVTLNAAMMPRFRKEIGEEGNTG